LAFSGLVKDINAGTASTSIGNLTAAGDVLYFSASDTSGGNELWRSDGTSEGTFRVADISPGSASSSPTNFFLHGGTLYFSATDGTGRCLWKTDGTASGTVKVLDSLGASIPEPDRPVVMGDVLYVRATGGIWRTDGTPSGTVNTGLAGSNLAVVGSNLYFARAINVIGQPGKYELCKSDGTVAGTSVVFWSWQSWSSIPANLTEVGGRLFFDATWYGNNNLQRTAVYCCNGTSAFIVQDFASLAMSVATDTHIYFTGKGQSSVYDNIYGVEAASSSANSADRLVYTYGAIVELGLANNHLFFTGSIGRQAYRNFELWAHDIASGATSVVDVDASDATTSYPQGFAAYGGKVVFSASDSSGDRELWISDATVAGTRRLVDASSTGSGDPTLPFVVGDRLFFTATDGSAGRELWTYVANQAPTSVSLSSNSIAENTSTGTVVGALSTTDGDTDDTFTYTLVSGVGDTDNASFQIVGNSLQTKSIFDCETKNSYTVRVRSTDAGGLFTEKAFAITVTDVNEAPTVLALTGVTITLPESTSTTSRVKVADIVVTDDALGTNSLSLSGADAASFEIDGLGLYLKAGTSLNYEAKTTYAVTVSVADNSVGGSAAITADYVLALANTNESPTDITLSAASVAENAPVGTPIGALSTTDGDTDDTFTYTLVSGVGDTDNASFQIVGNSLQTKSIFDCETKNSYTVRVRSTDADGLFTEKAFAITVTDVNEAPTALALTGTTTTLPENTSTTSRIKVADIVVTDDALGTNSLSLSGADAASFEIDGLRLYLKAGISLNYEAKTTYAVTVSVADSTLSASTPRTANYSLAIANVNEAPVLISLNPSAVAENSPRGTVVGRLSTIDEDAGDTFTYALIAGTGDFSNAAFTIEGDAIKTAALFDFEAQSSYSIRVYSQDAGRLSIEQAFTIMVSDVNEGPSGLALANVTTSLPENRPTTSLTEVADIIVTDDALGINTLSLSGADAASFEIDGSKLYLKAGTTLNYEAQTVYAVAVSVVDSNVMASTPRTANYTLTITDIVEPRSAPRVVAPEFFTIVEDTPTALVFPAAPFSDADSPLTKVMTVTVNVASGTMSAVSAGGVTVAGTATTRTFTGNLANLNAFFTAIPSRLVYTPARNATATSVLSFTIAEKYGTQTMTFKTTSLLRITAINDAPVVVAPGRFVVREDTRSNLSWRPAETGFADVDSASLTVTLAVPDGSLFASSAGGVAVTGTATTRVLTGSPAALTAYFRTVGRIAYTPALDNIANRTLTTTVTDGMDTRVATSTIAIRPVNDVPRILAAAVINGAGFNKPVELSYDMLRTATGATDADMTNPMLVIQNVLSGTLQRWSGTAWVRVSTTGQTPPAQRSLQPGQRLRWIPPSGTTGLQNAFRMAASDGAATSVAACTVRISIT
jgi:ELWxxDGT repeat protein